MSMASVLAWPSGLRLSPPDTQILELLALVVLPVTTLSVPTLHYCKLGPLPS